MIRVKFRVGTLKLRGDTDKLGQAVERMRADVREAQQRSREFDAAARRLRSKLLGVVERALLNG